MNDFIQRMQAERDGLHGRAVKLMEYIMSPAFGELSEAMQDLLKRQLNVMDDYERILSERLALVGGES
jgi:hypothetical protein